MFKQRIDYRTTKPDMKQYWVLFESTGWNHGYNFSVEDLDNALDNSWYIISAYVDSELIGFGRIISDGIHHALIVDLIITPEHQGKGIGSELLKKLLKECTDYKIRDIQLFSAEDKFKLYEKYGFIKRAENAPGMEFKY